MNKLFITIALCTVFFGAVCANNEQLEAGAGESEEEFSMMSVIPADDEEIAYLTNDNRAFSDYCIQARDDIKNFMRSSAHGAAASVFDTLFTQVNDVGSDLLQAESSALKEGTELIQQHSVPQSDAATPEVKENLEETVENLSLIQTVSKAVKVVINAVIETAKSAAFQRFAMLRAQLNGDNLKEKLNDACSTISLDLQRKLESKMQQTKNSMRASAGKPGAPTMETIQKARYDNVGCLTTGRVGKIVKFCDFLRVAGPTVFPLLGM